MPNSIKYFNKSRFKSVPEWMLPKSFSFWSLAMRACWICSILTCRASTSPSSLLFSVFSQLSSGSSAAWNKKMTQDPFFTLPFTVPNKRHAAQAALQIWDKAIGQLFASYHFPLNNKERDTKKSLRGGHFVLSRPLCRSLFCAWKTEGCTLHTKPGTFFYWQE